MKIRSVKLVNKCIQGLNYRFVRNLHQTTNVNLNVIACTNKTIYYCMPDSRNKGNAKIPKLNTFLVVFILLFFRFSFWVAQLQPLKKSLSVYPNDHNQTD